jgi:hypothetical protein
VEPLPKRLACDKHPSLFGSERRTKVGQHWSQFDLLLFLARSEKFLELLDDLEILMKTNEHFLLGPWLESAKALAADETHKALLEYNARIQVITKIYRKFGVGSGSQVVGALLSKWSDEKIGLESRLASEKIKFLSHVFSSKAIWSTDIWSTLCK